MTTKEFLSYFTDFCIQVFDDVETRKDPKLAVVGKPSRFKKEQLEQWNKEGRGIFFSVNKVPSGARSKINVTGINAWFAESDDITIEEQWKRIVSCSLQPSFVVKSKKSLHIYWLAKDATKENFERVQNGLCAYFDGDSSMTDISRVLRIPGFYHMKKPETAVMVELIEANPDRVYTEQDMLAGFPYTEPIKTVKKYNKREPASNNFWDILGALDNKMMLERLSGDLIVNKETFTFRKRYAGGEYIDVNGELADAWLDTEGFIGSGKDKKGGPTWIQWLGYYGRSKAEIAAWAKRNLKEYIPKEIDIPIKKESDYLISKKMSDVEIEPINWLWPGKLAKGKVSILGGNPGLGKSQITLAMAACITTGTPFPCTSIKPAIGSVILFSTEDDPSDTIAPRLEANGADKSKVHIVLAVQRGDKEKHFNLEEDVDLLAKKIREIGDVALVIVDPISAYLGKADTFKDSIVRSMVAPFAKVASDYKAAFLGLMHLRKNTNGDPVAQFIGSVAFSGFARAAYLVIKDEHDERRRLMVCAKNNVGEDMGGLAYRIEPYEFNHKGVEIKTSKIVWETEQIEMSAAEAMHRAEKADKDADTKIGEARNFLHGILSEHPEGLPRVLILQKAEELGIAKRTLLRAKDELYIKTSEARDESGNTLLRHVSWQLVK